MANSLRYSRKNKRATLRESIMSGTAGQLYDSRWAALSGEEAVEDMCDALLRCVLTVMDEATTASLLSKHVRGEILHRFVKGHEDLITFIMVREDEGSLFASGVMEPMTSAVRGRNADKSLHSANVGAGVRRRGYMDADADERRDLRFADLASSSSTSHSSHTSSLTVITGLPLQNDDCELACYCYFVGPVRSPDDVVIGLMEERPLEYCSTILRSYQEEDTAAALTSLALHETRAARVPQVRANTFNSQESIAEYVLAFARMISTMTAQCYQSEQPILGKDDGLTEGPRYELQLWLSCTLTTECILEHADKETVRDAVSQCHEAARLAFEAARQRAVEMIKDTTMMARTLASLDHLLQPLYGSDYSQVVTSIPLLCHSVMYLRQISQHYACFHNLSRLLRRITLQIITHLKAIIGVEKRGEVLWHLVSTAEGVDEMLPWCEQVQNLSQVYRNSVKQASQTSSQGPLAEADLEEKLVNSVTGELELFCKRVAKLQELLTYMKRYSLLSASHLPGTEQCVNRFQRLVNQLRTSGVDVFEYTTPAFDKAFMVLRASLVELDMSLRVIINNEFENITDVNASFVLLKTYASALPPSIYSKKYTIILENVASDMVRMHNYFLRWKDSPPSHRNALPLVSSIAWSRLISKKLSEKATILSREYPEAASKVFKRAVAAYNHAAAAVVRHESSCLAHCQSYFKSGLEGLKSPPILIWDDQGLKAHIDSAGMLSLNAARQLQKLGVELPLEMKTSLELIPLTTKNSSLLQSLVDNYAQILEDMPSYLRFVTAPMVNKVNQALGPGLKGQITWMSVGISQFIEEVETAVTELANTMGRVQGILDWIYSALQSIATAEFVDFKHLPFDSLEHFVEAQKAKLAEQPRFVQRCSDAVERGCNVLLDIFPDVAPSCREKLLQHFHLQVTRELTNATVQSLQALKHAVTHRCISDRFIIDKPVVLFILTLDVWRGELVVSPEMDDVLDAVTQVSRDILCIAENVERWKSYPQATSLHAEVMRSRQIMKKLFLLTGACEEMEEVVRRYIDRYNKYADLWEGGKVASDDPEPLEHYHSIVAHYDEQLKQVKALPDEVRASPFLIDLRQLRAKLTHYVLKCMHLYLKPLHVEARANLEELKRTLGLLERKLRADEALTLASFGSLMKALDKVRVFSSDIDLLHTPLSEKYAFLVSKGFDIPSIEMNIVSDVQYRWGKIKLKAGAAQEYVNSVQMFLRRDLVLSIQRFGVEVTVFDTKFSIFKTSLDSLSPPDALERLRKNRDVISEMMHRCFEMYEGAQLFSVHFRRYPLLERCDKELEQLMRMYKLRARIQEEEDHIRNTLWVHIDLTRFAAQVAGFTRDFKDLPAAVADRCAFKEMSDALNHLKTHIPLFKMLSEPFVQQRHWLRLMQICNHQWSTKADVFLVKELLDVNLTAKREKVEKLVLCASKEAHIERTLSEITEQWKTRSLKFVPRFIGWGDILSTADAYEIKDSLDESQMMLTTLLSNRYINFFKDEALSWMKRLATTSEMLTQWIEVQAAWMHIEVVFAGDTIARQLPDEVRRFAIIDQQWCKIITRAKRYPNVVACCTGNDLAVLPSLARHLSDCQKTLHVYLEEKREAFPRLYFVSESMLLRILASADASFIPTLFDGVQAVQTGIGVDGVSSINALVSYAGSTFPLSNPVQRKGNVEKWLEGLRQESQNTMRELMRQAVSDVYTPSANIDDHYFLSGGLPLQLQVLLLQLLWTVEVTAFLSASAKGEPRKKDEGRFKIVELAASLLRLRDSLAFSPNFSVIVMVVLTLSDAAKRIFDERQKDGTSAQWEFTKQLRAYWKGEVDVCTIRCVEAEVTYGLDYIGHRQRLVQTPLTARCFVSMFQALVMSQCSALVGPSGVGKTETVKDLAATCARCVIVVSCSRDVDILQLTRTLRGLVQAGDWGLFDDIVNVPGSVLSTVSSNLQCILNGMKKRAPTFKFTDGTMCKANPNFGCFLTYDSGARAASAIPSNLRSQYRMCAMQLQDRLAILQMKVRTAGRDLGLATKLDLFYRMAEDKYGKHRFGLRAMLAALKCESVGVALSKLNATTLAKRKESRFCELGAPMVQAHVTELVWKFHVPGLHAEELEDFTELFQSIFGQVEMAMGSHKLLNDAAKKLELSTPHKWAAKVQHFHVMSLEHRSVAVIGPPGCGKSTAIRLVMCVRGAQQKQKKVRIYPRALACSEMYGHFDVSNTWRVGIFASLWAKANTDSGGTLSTWVVCDGPLHASWTSYLHTVLDSTRVLSLPNGERIHMAPGTRMVFESGDMSDSTPALVTRVPVIAFFANEITVSDTIEAALSRVERKGEFEGLPSSLCASIRQHLIGHSRGVYEVCEELFTRHRGALELNVLYQQVVDTCCHSLQQLRRVIDPAECCERVCWGAIATAFGTVCGPAVRVRLDKFIRERAPHAMPPKSPLIFSYTVSPTTGEWVAVVPQVSSVPSLLGSFVHTVRTQVIAQHAAACMKASRPVMLIGSFDSGKTMLMHSILRDLEDEHTKYQRVKMYPSCSAVDLRGHIETYCKKKMGSTYGPKGSRVMFLFFDDVSLPDSSRESDPSELVRQVVEAKGYWDTNDSKAGEWRALADVSSCAAMSTQVKEGSRRLPRHFVVMEVEPPTVRDMHYISRKVMTNVDADVKRMTVDLWLQCQRALLPAADTPQITWSQNKVWHVFQGVNMLPKPCKGRKEYVLALWKQEIERVFGDCLNRPEHRAWLRNKVQDMLADDVVACEDSVVHYYVTQQALTAEVSAQKMVRPSKQPQRQQKLAGMVFSLPKRSLGRSASILLQNTTSNMLIKNYNHTPTLPYSFVPHDAFLRALKRVQLLISEDRRHGVTGPIVLVHDMVEHVSRVARVLSRQHGAMLLVSQPGSGRVTLVRLAAVLCGKAFTDLTDKRNTAAAAFQLLKSCVKAAGICGAQCAVLKDDAPFAREKLIHSLLQLLDNGDPSLLFSQKEIDAINLTLLSPASDAKVNLAASAGSRLDDPSGYNDGPQPLSRVFIKRVRENFFFVLCVSPETVVSKEFTTEYSAFFKHCTVNWYMPWAQRAYVDVVSGIVQASSLCEAQSAKFVRCVASAAASMHVAGLGLAREANEQKKNTVLFEFGNLQKFAQLFLAMYQEKKKKVYIFASKTRHGLAKLKKTSDDVRGLQTLVAAKEEMLKETQQKQALLRAETYEITTDVQNKRRKVDFLRAEHTSKLDAVLEVRMMLQKELDVVKPGFEACRKVLESIGPHDMKVVKQASPPVAVKRCFDPLALLLHMPMTEVRLEEARKTLSLVDSWTPSGRLLAMKTDFAQTVADFTATKKEFVNEETLEFLQVYVPEGEDHSYDKLKKQCGSFGVLTTWVSHIVAYCDVRKCAEFYLDEVRSAEAKAAAAHQRLAHAQEAYEIVGSEARRVECALDEQRVLQQHLEEESAKIRMSSEAVVSLVEGLRSERDVWEKAAQTVHATVSQLPFNVLIYAFLSAYCGPFTEEFRGRLHEAARAACGELAPKCPLDEFFSAGEANEKVLASPLLSTALAPSMPGSAYASPVGCDVFYQENLNIIFTMLPFRYSLLRDPQKHGLQLLKECGARDINCFSAASEHFIENLTDSMRSGVPVILEDCKGTAHPDMFNLLQGDTTRVGRMQTVRVGRRVCEMRPGFELFLCVKESDVVIDKELAKLVNIVDFRPTSAGVEQALLGRVAMAARPELETERTQLRLSVPLAEAKVLELESKLLNLLANSPTEVIEDEELLLHIFETQQSLMNVKAQIERWTGGTAYVDALVRECTPLAVRGATIFAVAGMLSQLSPIYKTSLTHLIRIFTRTLAQGGSDKVGEITRAMFAYFGRTALEEHKAFICLLYSLMIGREQGVVPQAGVNALLSLGADEGAASEAPPQPFVPDDQEAAEVLEAAGAGVSAKVHLQRVRSREGRNGLFGPEYLLAQSDADVHIDRFAERVDPEGRDVDEEVAEACAAVSELKTAQRGGEAELHDFSACTMEGGSGNPWQDTAYGIRIEGARGGGGDDGQDEPQPGFLTLDPPPDAPCPDQQPQQPPLATQAPDADGGGGSGSGGGATLAPLLCPEVESEPATPLAALRGGPTLTPRRTDRYKGAGDDSSQQLNRNRSGGRKGARSEAPKPPEKRQGKVGGKMRQAIRARKKSTFHRQQGDQGRGDADGGEDTAEPPLLLEVEADVPEPQSPMSDDAGDGMGGGGVDGAVSHAELFLSTDTQEESHMVASFLPDMLVVQVMEEQGCFKATSAEEEEVKALVFVAAPVFADAPDTGCHASPPEAGSPAVSQKRRAGTVLTPPSVSDLFSVGPGVGLLKGATPTETSMHDSVMIGSDDVNQDHVLVLPDVTEKYAAQHPPAGAAGFAEAAAAAAAGGGGGAASVPATATATAEEETEEEAPEAEHYPHWLSPGGRANLKHVTKVYPPFAELTKVFDETRDLWKAWYDSEEPEALVTPSIHLSRSPTRPFDALLLYRCIRPDRMVQASRIFIVATLGEEFATSVESSYEDAIDQGSPTTPVLWMASNGADPCTEIDALCKRIKQSICIVTIGEDTYRADDAAELEETTQRMDSLRVSRLTICVDTAASPEEAEQGCTKDEQVNEVEQERSVWRKIEEELIKGAWVLLQNVHLSQHIQSSLVQHIQAQQAFEDKAWEELAQKRLQELASRGENDELALSTTAYAQHKTVRLPVMEKESGPIFHGTSRLLCTADLSSVDTMPSFLLENSHVVSIGRPTGVKRTLKKTLGSLSADVVGTFRRTDYRTLVYAICLTHALVSNRARFSNNGLSADYLYQSSDVAGSLSFLHQHFGLLGDGGLRSKQVDFNCLDELIGGVFLSADVTDFSDRRVVLGQISLYFASLRGTPLAAQKPIEIAPGYTACWDMSAHEVQHSYRALPDTESAQAFGLHESVSVDYCASSPCLLRCVKALTPSDEAPVPHSQAVYLLEVLLLKISVVAGDGRKLVEIGAPSSRYCSVDNFHKTEVAALRAVVSRARQQLKDLVAGLRGLREMTHEQHSVLECVTAGRIPDDWVCGAKKGHSGRLLQWAQDIERRHEQLENWERHGMPLCVWVGGLFNPKSFIAALLQDYAAGCLKQLTDLQVHIRMSKYFFAQDVAEGALAGRALVYLSGLVLEGASWDAEKACLSTEPFQKSLTQQANTPLLAVTVSTDGDKKREVRGSDGNVPHPPAIDRSFYFGRPRAKEKKAAEPAPSDGDEGAGQTGEVPCFSCSARGDENLLFQVPVKLESKNFWAAKGIAFIAQ